MGNKGLTSYWLEEIAKAKEAAGTKAFEHLKQSSGPQIYSLSLVKKNGDETFRDFVATVSDGLTYIREEEIPQYVCGEDQAKALACVAKAENEEPTFSQPVFILFDFLNPDVANYQGYVIRLALTENLARAVKIKLGA